MNSRVCSVLISFWLHLAFQWSGAIKEESFLASKGFLAYRTVSSFQKYCSCSTTYSCSCCQSVTILYTKAEKNLCVNFIYERNGLNIDVTLNSNSIKARRVTGNNATASVWYIVILTTLITRQNGTLFLSKLYRNCAIRSVTACLRLDIFSKKRVWQISYDCVSLSTETPTMTGNGTMQMTNGTGGSSGTSSTTGMTSAMSSSQMTTMNTGMTSAMSSSQMTTMNTGMTSAMSSSQMTTNTATMMTMTMTTTMTTTTTTTTTTMMTTKAEVEKTTRDVEVITIPGSEPSTIVDID